jgi:Prokaryotic Cytochrome C oxidase subunit IV
MTGHNPPKPRSVWLLLMGLSIFSTFVAERTHHASYAIAAIFIIAAVKGDLVIMQYMEAGRAAPHWKLMYRAWLIVVTLLLVVGYWAGQ